MTHASPSVVLKMIQAGDLFGVCNLDASQHFRWGELLCHRTIAQLKTIKPKHLENLATVAQRIDRVRTQLGNHPIIITSGWRDSVTNRKVGGARLSRHLTGEAVDIAVLGMTPKAVQDALESTWQGGMGYGKTFTHLDIRGFKARFNY